LRAIREVLAGGLPVSDLPTAEAALRLRSAGAVVPTSPRIVYGTAQPTTTSSTILAPLPPATAWAASLNDSRMAADQQVQLEVAQQIQRLSDLWLKHDFPAGELCQVLEAIVFPAGRPGEIVLYEQPVTRELTGAASIGRTLVEWAHRANRTDDLIKAIEARQLRMADVVAGHVLRIRLYVVAGNLADARSQLMAVNQFLKGKNVASLYDLAAHAAAAGLDEPKLNSETLALIETLLPIVTRDIASALRLARDKLAADTQKDADARREKEAEPAK